ncbi:MAG: enoyl-CoA hydratase [Aestuariivirgaceae bacterium]
MITDLVPCPSPTPHLTAGRRGSTGWLVLNRPERRNALSAEMWRAIPDLVRRLADDPEVRALALMGEGGEAFAAGADISEFAGNRDDAAAARCYDAMTIEAFAALEECPKPVVAVINGYCLGGGLALALACDIRLASDRAIFALPPARLGLAYPLAGMRQLLAAVTAARAKELLFTARRVDAAEASRIGLVHMTVGADSLRAEAESVLGMLAANAPLSIAAAKGMINALSGVSGDPRPEALATLADACFGSDDYKEGRRAFLEKRPPRFSGR